MEEDLIGAPARVGLVAPVDVVVPPANTGLDVVVPPANTEALEKILEQKQ
ncbi:hypothetical protein Tco_0561822, partial [Tanacetum coccineum]